LKVAVIYYSKYGTTEKVASSIVEKLMETNEVECFSLKKNLNPDISGFNWVILGTPIYAGQPSKKMKAFCKKNEPVLLEKKTALFVCGMEPYRKKREKEVKDAYPNVLQDKAFVAAFLGGAFLFERMNFVERLIIRKIAKTYKTVERILWDDINDFVRKILKLIS